MDFRLDLIAAQRGVSARMIFDGLEIGSSREPLYEGARLLLGAGVAKPEDQLTTYRDGTPCLTGIVGKLSELTVEDRGTGMRRRRLTERDRLTGAKKDPDPMDEASHEDYLVCEATTPR